MQDTSQIETKPKYKPRTYKDSKAAKRHQLFIENLISDPDRNATKAYQKVYPNCSYQTAIQNSSQLLTKTYINEQIEKREAEILAKTKNNTEITRDLILTQIQTDRIDAKCDKQHSVAMKGNELLARIKGYLVDKSITMSISFEDYLKEMRSRKPEIDDDKQ